MIMFKGKGFIVDMYFYVVGVFGCLGMLIVSWFMNESDLIIVLGLFFFNYMGIEKVKCII